ncbi:hypothetical protein M0802_000479 [Mischocyttarus mexicanus]|nr:hypothetical protein M0802_000479 [Mischocyttarus mexicanus]
MVGEEDFVDDGNETNELSYFAWQGQKKKILREADSNWSILKLITIILDCSSIAVVHGHAFSKKTLWIPRNRDKSQWISLIGGKPLKKKIAISSTFPKFDCSQIIRDEIQDLYVHRLAGENTRPLISTYHFKVIFSLQVSSRSNISTYLF